MAVDGQWLLAIGYRPLALGYWLWLSPNVRFTTYD